MGEPTRSNGPRADLPTALAVGFTAVLPSFMIWLLFIVLAADDVSPTLHLAVDVAWKVTTVAFPLLFMLLWERRRPRLSWPNRNDLLFGLGFGLVVTAGIFALYYGWLRSSPLLQSAPAAARPVLRKFGADQLPGYLLVASFIAVANSLLEEYYFRWFIFGRLRAFLSAPSAIAVSALIFMAHHVILLNVYLPGRFWTLTIPLSLCIGVGGAIWSWLYARMGSLYAPWLSHALIDAAIAVVGWDVLHIAA
ncbi:MAG TPA: CPBP family intramembrane glutamic endopeptidase [Gemmataceae bacterium]|nr:CPBP family intramembrane glutamic endopeptidase [Gemmataceae bacterium]